MSIPVTCPQCGATNKVNDSLAGRRVRCPECDTAVHVPEWDTSAPPPLPGGLMPGETPMPGAEADDEAVEVEAVPVEVEATPVQTVGKGASTIIPSELHHHGLEALADSREEEEEDDDDDVMPRRKREEEELDMTPMVDVTFLLLIFFMVTAAFSLQKSIEMPRQQTDAPSLTVVEDEQDELEMTEVQVDQFGSFLVLAPNWQDETPGKQNLTNLLKRAIEGSSGMRLVIKVEEDCKLQFLVDAMDAGAIAGFAETQVTQVEELD